LSCFISDEKVSSELKKALMQARLDKKLTQAQLAQVFTCKYSGLFFSTLERKRSGIT
jgi:hypothetical protein